MFPQWSLVLRNTFLLPRSLTLSLNDFTSDLNDLNSSLSRMSSSLRSCMCACMCMCVKESTPWVGRHERAKEVRHSAGYTIIFVFIMTHAELREYMILEQYRISSYSSKYHMFRKYSSANHYSKTITFHITQNIFIELSYIRPDKTVLGKSMFW